MTTFSGESPSDRYYIQDSRGYVGNNVLWWRPGGNGYTCDLSEAGLYSKVQAAGNRPTDFAWPVEVINPLAIKVVDVQRLPKR